MKYSELIQWTVNQTAMQLAACSEVDLPWIFQKLQLHFFFYFFLLVTDYSIHKHRVTAVSLNLKLPHQKLGEEGFLRAGKQTFSSDCKQMAGCQVKPPVLALIYITAGSELKAAHHCIQCWFLRFQINARPLLPMWRQKVKRSVAFIRCTIELG